MKVHKTRVLWTVKKCKVMLFRFVRKTIPETKQS